jgi:hypothetical protein
MKNFKGNMIEETKASFLYHSLEEIIAGNEKIILRDGGNAE